MFKSIQRTATLFMISISLVSVSIAGSLSSCKVYDDKDKLVEMEIKSTKAYVGNSYVIELTKKGGEENWVLPMVIGECEAIAVARSQNNTSFPRPLTYDLFISIFNKTKVKLKHIVITKLEDNTFYAILVLEENGKTIEIDARPSDSINIAMKAKVPIYATQAVLDAAKETSR